jgi:hypothetical protein
MAQFKGGVYVHSPEGYLRISAGPCRDSLVHVLVAEAMLRRPMRKDEVIHHKDGNERNPRWTNLLITDKRTHDAVSNRQYWYLKQRYAREDAAWRAYFDVTGETYEEYDKRVAEEVSFQPAEFQ